ncbi:hypothetical protein DWX95_02480 [Butyricicoccus sp. AF22-28AC]|nr:hypothetical protein DWX95_02480 [Butyricicoccus sp. AF22-28AC]
MERRVNSKDSCTVWGGGKAGDYFEGLPIAIRPNAGDSRSCNPCFYAQQCVDRKIIRNISKL